MIKLRQLRDHNHYNPPLILVLQIYSRSLWDVLWLPTRLPYHRIWIIPREPKTIWIYLALHITHFRCFLKIRHPKNLELLNYGDWDTHQCWSIPLRWLLSSLLSSNQLPNPVSWWCLVHIRLLYGIYIPTLRIVNTLSRWMTSRHSALSSVSLSIHYRTRLLILANPCTAPEDQVSLPNKNCILPLLQCTIRSIFPPCFLQTFTMTTTSTKVKCRPSS